ncbi:MAG TPA: ATP-dependent protease ATPase subunit HslU [Planctomycetota bacterium]|nr:ATP-dependent protease ATPase subunit HslU [Planctomycetota bacterium]
MSDDDALTQDLTPQRIVEALDRYVVGQAAAKRAVAVAIRNRWRRMRLDPDLREEVMPKNILLIGPTGVGKTEIARRIAGLMRAPFVKVEATKYTEVGYVGRDVESIVRDLLEVSLSMVRAEQRESVRVKAREAAEERVLDALLPGSRPGDPALDPFGASRGAPPPEASGAEATRVKLRERLRAGALDEREVEVQVEEAQSLGNVFGASSFEQTGIDFQGLIDKLGPNRRRTRRAKVPEAMEVLTAQEADKLVDRENLTAEAIRRVEQTGIVFLDELDKVAGRRAASGPDVSREGVQRDLLPLVEGTTVSTRHGSVRTEHVLFIAAGAFHVSKPSDLMPELQGRFPIRVQLEPLTEADFVRILEEPKNALTRQYAALLATEGVALSFTPDGVREVARVAAEMNASHENIGARRLSTILERVVEEVSFDAPARRGSTVLVNAEFVRRRVASVLADQDLARYVL